MPGYNSTPKLYVLEALGAAFEIRSFLDHIAGTAGHAICYLVNNMVHVGVSEVSSHVARNEYHQGPKRDSNSEAFVPNKIIYFTWHICTK